MDIRIASAASLKPMMVGLVTVKKELQNAVLSMMPSLRPPWTGVSHELVTIGLPYWLFLSPEKNFPAF